MFSELGFFSLILSDLFFIIYFINIFINGFNLNKNLLNIIINLIYFLITLSFLSLIISFIKSDFIILNVLENSHTDQPLLYKISGAWGNHEGSMLLWTWFLISYLYFFSFSFVKLPKKLIDYFVFIEFFLIFFFVNFIIFTSNPFLTLLFTVINGSELNPILQDPLLIIHPPLIYLGYLGLSLTFSLTLSYLLSIDKVNFTLIKDRTFNYYLYKTTLISWIFLTLGIFLGSWWAYYELGWGGWWFWDPVENASLMPWLLSTALLHSVIVSLKRNVLKNWTIILSLISFLLSLIGTFFVRSGLLNSVHSFAQDSVRGLFILIFTVFLFLVVIYVLFNKRKNIFIYDSFSPISKEFFIILNNLFLIIFCLIVFIGTVTPFFFEFFLSREISLGSSFYNDLLMPLLIPFLIIFILGPRINWKNNLISKSLEKYLFSLTFVSVSLIFLQDYISNLYVLIYFFVFLWFIGSTIEHFLFNKNVNKNYFIPHIGFMSFVIGGFISSNFNMETTTILHCGDYYLFKNFIFLLKNINIIDAPNYQAIFGNFLIFPEKLFNNNFFNMFPEKRFYFIQTIFTTKAAIYTNFFYDIYVVLGDGNFIDGWFTRINYQPGISLIWLGACLMIIGGFINLLRNNLKKRISFY